MGTAVVRVLEAATEAGTSGVRAVVTSQIEYTRIDGRTIVLVPGVTILVDLENQYGQFNDDAFAVEPQEYSLLS